MRPAEATGQWQSGGPRPAAGDARSRAPPPGAPLRVSPGVPRCPGCLPCRAHLLWASGRCTSAKAEEPGRLTGGLVKALRGGGGVSVSADAHRGQNDRSRSGSSAPQWAHPGNQAFAPLGLRLSITQKKGQQCLFQCRGWGRPPPHTHTVCFLGAQHRPLSRQTEGSGAVCRWLSRSWAAGAGGRGTAGSGGAARCEATRDPASRGRLHSRRNSRRQPTLQSRGLGHAATATVSPWHPLPDAHSPS